MCADIRIDTVYASGNLFCLYLVCAKSPTFIGGSLRSRVSAVSVAIAVNTATIAATCMDAYDQFAELSLSPIPVSNAITEVFRIDNYSVRSAI